MPYSALGSCRPCTRHQKRDALISILCDERAVAGTLVLFEYTNAPHVFIHLPLGLLTGADAAGIGAHLCTPWPPIG